MQTDTRREGKDQGPDPGKDSSTISNKSFSRPSPTNSSKKRQDDPPTAAPEDPAHSLATPRRVLRANRRGCLARAKITDWLQPSPTPAQPTPTNAPNTLSSAQKTSKKRQKKMRRATPALTLPQLLLPEDPSTVQEHSKRPKKHRRDSFHGFHRPAPKPSRPLSASPAISQGQQDDQAQMGGTGNEKLVSDQVL